MRPGSPRHPIRTATVIASLALPAACAPQGASYDHLGMRAEHAADGTPVSGAAADYCLVMPVLPGSRVDERVSVEGPLEISLSATNDRVLLDIAGAAEAHRHTVWAEQLAGEYSETLELQSSTGTLISLILSSSCP